MMVWVSILNFGGVTNRASCIYPYISRLKLGVDWTQLSVKRKWSSKSSFWWLNIIEIYVLRTPQKRCLFSIVLQFYLLHSKVTLRCCQVIDFWSRQVEVVFSEATSLFDYSAMQAMNKISSEYKAKGRLVFPRFFRIFCGKMEDYKMHSDVLIQNGFVWAK